MTRWDDSRRIGREVTVSRKGLDEVIRTWDSDVQALDEIYKIVETHFRKGDENGRHRNCDCMFDINQVFNLMNKEFRAEQKESKK